MTNPTQLSGVAPGRVWLSVTEAQRYTGIAKTSLYEALQTGELAGSQRGGKRGKWRIHMNDIDAWMRSQSPQRGVA